MILLYDGVCGLCNDWVQFTLNRDPAGQFRFAPLQGPTAERILNKYGKDYKVIFVGDATMSPYEITYPGGSVEHWNEEPGAIWIDRVTQQFDSVAWLNPTAERHWDHTPSIGVMKQLMNNRMFPLTIAGLEKAMKELVR